jgi:N-methylhydantoinase B
MVRDTMWTAPTEHHLMSLRAKRAAGFGVEGGRDGRAGGVWVFDAPADGVAGAPGTEPEAYAAATPLAGVVDPETNVLDPSGAYVYPFPPAGHATAPGAILRYVNAGGGGWGDPLQRDPEAVKRDVRDGYVTLEGAARDYGVVISGDPDEDPEGLTLDLAATERLRAQHSG